MASTLPGPSPGNFVFKGSMDAYSALDAQKRESPAAERNKQPIAEVLLEYLAPAAASGNRPLILEVASGSGQHAAHFASVLPGCDMQPSDLTPELFGSIAAYAAGRTNVRLPPLLLDASSSDWPCGVAAALAAGAPTAAVAAEPEAAAAPAAAVGVSAGQEGASPAVVEAVVCINMCHISPLAATRGLLRGAGQVLRPGRGLLFVYGPFTRGRHHTTDSNAAFDASLRARNPQWGYRELEDMGAWGGEAGLELLETREMPANNFMLVFRKR